MFASLPTTLAHLAQGWSDDSDRGEVVAGHDLLDQQVVRAHDLKSNLMKLLGTFSAPTSVF